MKLVRMVFCSVVIALLMAASASPAGAATSVAGSVSCVSGRSVVGVWIKAEKGGSGWAKRTGSGSTQRYSYSLPKGGRYQVHVGCGGSAKKWATNNKSSYVSGRSNSFTCYDTRSARGAYLFCQRT